MPNLKKNILQLCDLLLPRRCAMCDELLQYNERCVCNSCMVVLDERILPTTLDNQLTNRLPIDKYVSGGISLLKYAPSHPQHSIFVAMKYRGRADACIMMGKMLAQSYLHTDFFSTIDVIIPLPLHKKRKRDRGYNQCEFICKGISQTTGIPVESNCLKRRVNNPSQTTLGKLERQKNVKGIFGVDHADRLQGKHILLVDDIITSGATISSAMKCLHEAAPTALISVACIGLTRDE